LIDLPFDDPAAVEAMLQFLYTFDYCCPEKVSEAVDSELPLGSAIDPNDNRPQQDEPVTSLSALSESEVGILKGWDPIGLGSAAGSLPELAPLRQPGLAENSEAQSVSPMLFHVQVYALGDRIQNMPLKNLAQEKFEAVASKEWNSSDLPAAVQAIYSVAPPGVNGNGFRETIIRIVVEHSRDLFILDCGLSTMVQKIPDFGKDMVKALSGAGIHGLPKPGLDLEELKCLKCSFTFKATLDIGFTHLTCPLCKQEKGIREWFADNEEARDWPKVSYRTGSELAEAAILLNLV